MLVENENALFAAGDCIHFQSLAKLAIPQDDSVLLGAKEGKDCALTRFSENTLCLHSIDQFRSFISDSFLLVKLQPSTYLTIEATWRD
jgi:hypothetical protein